MMLELFKYHGLGNDFLILPWQAEELPSTSLIRRLTDRHRGVGGDGVLLVRRLDPSNGQPRVGMIIFNRDGTRPEMCGNGVRCVAAFAVQQWAYPTALIVESDAGPRACEVREKRGDHGFIVAVDMGAPQVSEEAERWDMPGLDEPLSFRRVSMGNPHAVVFSMLPLDAIDAAGERANRDRETFPEGVNLEFVAREAEALRTVVFERGVGRTEACGTGACAVAAAAWKEGFHAKGRTTVLLPGGKLIIEPVKDSIWMEGPAEFLFETRWDVERSE